MPELCGIELAHPVINASGTYDALAARQVFGEAIRVLCAEHGVASELALESPMACGFGACFGCAVPKPGGGYLRLCIDGPVLSGDQVEEVNHAYA